MPVLQLIQSMSWLSIVIFALGVLFLIIELCNPGFGAPGIIGLVLFAVDIFITAKTFIQGLVMTGILAVVVLIFVVISIILVSKGKLPATLMLKNSADKKSGFSGSGDFSKYLGAQGKAMTPLRPSGVAEIDGDRVDVVSRGEFIEANTEIEVVEISGNRVVVKRR